MSSITQITNIIAGNDIFKLLGGNKHSHMVVCFSNWWRGQLKFSLGSTFVYVRFLQNIIDPKISNFMNFFYLKSPINQFTMSIINHISYWSNKNQFFIISKNVFRKKFTHFRLLVYITFLFYKIFPSMFR